ncbi:Pseudouridine synthase, catalytic domain-containing protein [Melia azedarach]|uniref:Pseudouridine synthase, catalytic domain-containing protein n=1 Tax=Melia azedarach TaxID=155640 RepID=A0ACC1XQX3_MELAZ|nr:Pseudouridine synthase, catalytic domain-containing protein [Melia azedarach]
MGVSYPAVTFRAPSQHRDIHVTAAGAAAAGAGTRSRKSKKKRVSPTFLAAPAATKKRWWWICGDDDTKPASLGEFLEVERRFGDTAYYDAAAAELEGVMVSQQERQEEPRNGRLLFADGRVLPPADDRDETSSRAEVLCRFPVSITGICR